MPHRGSSRLFGLLRYAGATIKELNSQCKQYENDLSNILQKRNLTQKQVEHIDNVLCSLENIDLDLSDLDSIHDMFQNAKNENYDVSKIIYYLNQNKSLKSALEEKQLKLSKIEVKIKHSQKNHEDLLLRHENLTLRHDSMLKSIQSVESLGKKGVNQESISVWHQIFDSFGLEPAEFAKELKNIGDKNKINRNLDSKKSKLQKEIARLEKTESWLENKRDDLNFEISSGTEYCKKNLKKIIEHSEFQINNTVTQTTKTFDSLLIQNQTRMDIVQKKYEAYFSELISKLENLLEHSHKAEHSLAQMEALKPLIDLINDKFDPATNISEIVIILDKLYVNIKGTDLDKHYVSSEIKRLRDKLLDLISHA